MKRMEVKSSNITSIGYSYDSKVMEIEFHNNRVYDYYKVTKRVFEGMVIAKSKGKYFHKMIRGVYAYKWINSPKNKGDK